MCDKHRPLASTASRRESLPAKGGVALADRPEPKSLPTGKPDRPSAGGGKPAATPEVRQAAKKIVSGPDKGNASKTAISAPKPTPATILASPHAATAKVPVSPSLTPGGTPSSKPIVDVGKVTHVAAPAIAASTSELLAEGAAATGDIRAQISALLTEASRREVSISKLAKRGWQNDTLTRLGAMLGLPVEPKDLEGNAKQTTIRLLRGELDKVLGASARKLMPEFISKT